MNGIRQIQDKKDKQFFFEMKLNWLTSDRGILTSATVKDSIRVATPPEFGGEKGQWSPEDLFLGAISSCFMTTYLSFVKKMGFSIAHFECNAIGQVALVEGRYEFTTINVYPKVYIADDEVREKAITALQKTQKYCLISNSVKSQIVYHGEVLSENYFHGFARTSDRDGNTAVA